MGYPKERFTTAESLRERFTTAESLRERDTHHGVHYRDTPPWCTLPGYPPWCTPTLPTLVYTPSFLPPCVHARSSSLVNPKVGERVLHF